MVGLHQTVQMWLPSYFRPSCPPSKEEAKLWYKAHAVQHPVVHTVAEAPRVDRIVARMQRNVRLWRYLRWNARLYCDKTQPGLASSVSDHFKLYNQGPRMPG
jgi:hypothetical protein